LRVPHGLCVARRTLETDSLVPSSKMSYRRPLTISGIYSFQGGNTCQRRLKLVRAGVGLRRRRNAPGAVRKGTPKSKIRMDEFQSRKKYFHPGPARRIIIFGGCGG
jgi:hypothetical protein